jgi:hypothetical protein
MPSLRVSHAEFHAGRCFLLRFDLKSEAKEGFHRTKNVRWRTVSPLRDGHPSGLRARNRRPSGRNDKFGAVDDGEKRNFGEVASAHENRRKQKKMHSPAIGQLQDSGLIAY